MQKGGCRKEIRLIRPEGYLCSSRRRSSGNFFRLLFTGKIDNFDHTHGSGVAHALSQLDDAAVTAGTFGTGRSNGAEKHLDGFRVVNRTDGQAAGMQVAALAERNQLFNIGPQGLGLGKRRRNAAMQDQADCLIGKQSATVGSIAAGFFFFR